MDIYKQNYKKVIRDLNYLQSPWFEDGKILSKYGYYLLTWAKEWKWARCKEREKEAIRTYNGDKCPYCCCDLPKQELIPDPPKLIHQ